MSDQAVSTAAQAGGDSAPALGTPEYDAAMAAKADGLDIRSVSTDGSTVTHVGDEQSTEPPATDRPSWLPEKFKSAEDMAKAYSELESKFSGKTEEPPSPPKDEQPPTTESQPLDQNKYASEYAQNGQLSETSYAELAKVGIDKGTVDAYIAGQEALQAQRSAAGFQAVGGEENYRQMVSWAAANLSPAEANAFNSQVSGSSEQALLAISGLNAKYKAAVGSSPSGLLNGGARATQSTNGYGSRAQVVSDMSDARYESDAAFRKSVMDRLAVTADGII